MIFFCNLWSFNFIRAVCIDTLFLDTNNMQPEIDIISLTVFLQARCLYFMFYKALSYCNRINRTVSTVQSAFLSYSISCKVFRAINIVTNLEHAYWLRSWIRSAWTKPCMAWLTTRRQPIIWWTEKSMIPHTNNHYYLSLLAWNYYHLAWCYSLQHITWRNYTGLPPVLSSSISVLAARWQQL